MFSNFLKIFIVIPIILTKFINRKKNPSTELTYGTRLTSKDGLYWQSGFITVMSSIPLNLGF